MSFQKAKLMDAALLRSVLWRDAVTHLIRLPHVAVHNPPHALDGRVLQFMSAAHVIINAPV